MIRKGFFVLIALLFACSGKEKVPAGVLGQEDMVKVLTDIYLAEQKINKLGLRNDSAQQVFRQMKGKLFERTGIPDSVFKQSLDYYMDRPKELEMIYTALVDSLNLKEQRIPNRSE